MNDDTARANLSKIDHIVVLMMENRSFDHMLGYLKQDGMPTVEGLEPQMGNGDPDGVFHKVAPIGKRLINEKKLDPGHGTRDVQEQLSENNGGFVRNYAAALEKHARKRERRILDRALRLLRLRKRGIVSKADWNLVLGYQEAKDVPVYDYLARRYCVCDHWFSSYPGATWENRQFAVTGGRGPRDMPEFAKHLPLVKDAPLYDRPAFVQWLKDDDWRWYSHDPATLRMIDSRFRPGGEQNEQWDDNFAYFNRTTLFEQVTFLNDADSSAQGHSSAEGLRPVSWIDPNFVDFRLYGPPGSNDDHPPSPVMLGQELVLTIVRALANPQLWRNVLFVITYDEHGGFFDHVSPSDSAVPGAPNDSYGVRVPAIVISPYVEAGASHIVLDHTSIIKTILLRFAEHPDDALAAMGPRVEHANHLGELLTRSDADALSPPSDQDLDDLEDRVAIWKRDAYRGQLLEEPTKGERLFDAVSVLQGEIINASLVLRQEKNLTPGKP